MKQYILPITLITIAIFVSVAASKLEPKSESISEECSEYLLFDSNGHLLLNRSAITQDNMDIINECISKHKDTLTRITSLPETFK